MTNTSCPDRTGCEPRPSSVDGREDFLRQLKLIWEDPLIRRLAWSRAGDPEIAADALQETYCVLASHRDPEKIEDLRRYFATTLIHEIYRLLRQRRVTPVGDPAGVADSCPGGAWGQPRPERIDRTVCTQLLAQAWLGSLAAQRGYFTRRAPGRSLDPDRYRRLVVTVAERVLIAIVTGDVSDADSHSALRTEYPEWFAEEGCETANCHQRFKRARDDVHALLRLIISRDDLYP